MHMVKVPTPSYTCLIVFIFQLDANIYQRVIFLNLAWRKCKKMYLSTLFIAYILTPYWLITKAHQSRTRLPISEKQEPSENFPFFRKVIETAFCDYFFSFKRIQ